MRNFCLVVFVLFVSLQLVSAQIDSVEYYYNRFVQLKGNERIAEANKIFSYLDKYEVTDSLCVYTNSDTSDMYIALVYWMGYYYDVALNLYDKALYYNQIALNLCRQQNNQVYLGDVLNNIALCWQYKGDYPQALVYQIECYKLDSISGNLENQSYSLGNLAALYLSVNQPEAAETFLLEALEIEKQLNRSEFWAKRFAVGSEIYLKLNDKQKAYNFAYQAYKLDSADHRVVKAAVRLSQWAETLIVFDSLSRAEQCILKAIPVLDSVHNYYSLSICNLQMGRIYQHRGDNENAIRYYSDALDNCRISGCSYHEKTACRGLAACLKYSNPLLAFDYLERYSQLADSAYNEETAMQLSQYRIQFETEKIRHQKEETAKENLRIVVYTCVILFIMIFTLLGLVYIIKIKTRAQQLTNRLLTMREDFFNNITHEFRTPLTVILGLARRLQKDTSTIQNSSEIIERQGNRLLSLVNGLLDISKIKSSINPPVLVKSDIVVHIRMILEGLDYYATEKHIALKYRPHENNLVTMIEPEYLQKIISNLVANAIKYSPEYGVIDVTSNYVNKKFVINVADNGKGISEENIKHVFDTFYRVDESDNIVGTGIGLSLVKSCCEALDGEVSVSSSSNGSIFTVILPLKEVFEGIDSTIITNILTSSQKTSGHEILIIEDDADISYFIGSELNTLYNVTYAFNGEDGYEKAIQTLPDLIITDVKMPKMDGFELTQKIRNNSLSAHIPIIMVTAKINDSDKIHGIESGADAYLYKPFSSQELLLTISNLLEKYAVLQKRFASINNDIKVNDDSDNQVTIKNQDFILKLNDKIVSAMSKGKTDVETLASDMCMSRSQLHRKIVAVTGLTPTAYIIQIRIGIAKKMLDSDYFLPIGDVATKCGFDDVSYFSRVFKQICGKTPSQYRKQN